MGINLIQISLLGLFIFANTLCAKDAELTPELSQKLKDLAAGDLSKLEKIKLADQLQKAGLKKEALSLYEESLALPRIDPDVPVEAYLNYGTTLLENKEELKALGVYQSLKESLPPNDKKTHEVNDIMNKNIVTHFRIQDQKKKEQKKKDQQKKEDKDNKKQDSKNGEGQEPKEGEGKQDPQSGKSEKFPPDDKESPKNKEDKGDEAKEKDRPDEENKKDKDQQDTEDNKKEGSKPMPRRKVDPKLRQLMDDDRQLQMRMMENGTRELNKRKSRKSKDW